MKLRETGTASRQVALPACLAVIEHFPAVTNVTLEPEVVQTATESDAKVTGFPDAPPVAVSATGPPVRGVPEGALKLMT